MTSTYREPAKPAPSGRCIELSIPLARRAILGPCLWFLVFWFLVFVVAWVVEPLVRGEAFWKIPLALLVWPLFPFLVARAVRYETVLIGSDALRKVGFLKDHVVRWAEIESVRRFERLVKHRRVPIIGVSSRGREVLIAELVVEDPKNTLNWALEAAREGRLGDIDERVRAEGRVLRRARWYAPHVVTALILSTVLGVSFFRSTTRKHNEALIRRADQLHLAEREAALRPLLDDESLPGSTRCRVASMVMWAAAHRGDYAGALAHCQERVGRVCSFDPPLACDDFVAIRDARAALDAGAPAEALRLLEAWPTRGPARGAIEVPALVALGRLEEARAASESCLDATNDEDPSEAALALRCRLAP